MSDVSVPRQCTDGCKAGCKMAASLLEEKLISLVKDKSCLYDFSAEDYRDEIAKRDAWLMIATAMNDDGSGCQEWSVKKCSKKWKNLRDSYVRQKRKIDRAKVAGSPYCVSATWEHFDEMCWLDGFTRSYAATTIDAIPSSTSNEATGEEEQEIPMKLKNEKDPFDTEVPSSTVGLPPPKKRKKTAKPPAAEKRMTAAQKVKVLKEANNGQDALDLFGKSIVAQLRDIKSKKLRMKAQRDMQDIVFAMSCADDDAVVVS